MVDENTARKDELEADEVELPPTQTPEAQSEEPSSDIRLVTDNTEERVQKTLTNADLKQSQVEILALQKQLSEKRNKMEEIRLMLNLEDVNTIGSLEELEKSISDPNQSGEDAWKRRFNYLLISYQEDIDRIAVQLQQRIEESERIRGVIKAAQKDTLLDCYSKDAITKKAEKKFEESKEAGKPLSVLFVDLDYFKRINDTFGHQVGDRVLHDFTAMLNSEVRDRDYVGRYGGEEFMVVLPNATLEEANQVAERVRKRAETMSIMAKNLDGMDAEIPITASIGVSRAELEFDQDHEKMISRADAAVFQAKESERNLVVSSTFKEGGEPDFEVVTTGERKIPEPYERR